MKRETSFEKKRTKDLPDKLTGESGKKVLYTL